MSGTCWQVLKEVEWKWGFLISTYCTRCLEFFRTGMATTAGTLSLKISWGSDTPRFDVRGVRQQGWLMDQNQVNWRWWKGSIENNQLFSKFLLVVKHDCILYSRKGFSQSSAETWCHFFAEKRKWKSRVATTTIDIDEILLESRDVSQHRRDDSSLFSALIKVVQICIFRVYQHQSLKSTSPRYVIHSSKLTPGTQKLVC